MEEIFWKDVPGYAGFYEVSNHGIIRSLNRTIDVLSIKKTLKGIILKQRKDRNGYLIVTLSKEGVEKTYACHRLCASAFLNNEFNKRCINHINGIKTDNRIENLEFATHGENNLHAIKHGLKPYKKLVNVCSGAAYDSMSEAAKANDISYSKLKRIFCMGQKNDTCLRLAA